MIVTPAATTQQPLLEHAQSATAPPEQPAVELKLSQRFFRYFQQEVTALQEQMDRIADTAVVGGERADAVDHCLAGIARLSQEVKDAATYLPAYDQRTYAEAVKALTERLQKTRSTLAPKTRFQFKSRLFNNRTERPASLGWRTELHLHPSTDAPESAPEQRRAVRFSSTPATITDSASPKPAHEPTKEEKKDQQQNRDSNGDSPTPAFPAQPQPTIRRPSFSHATAIAISNQTREHIVLPASAAQAASSGALTNLRSCVVDMWEPTTTAAEGQQQQQRRPFATLQVRDVQDSLLACGTIDGPAHVTGVTGSVIVVACRQFRMHECRDCDVYLRVGSRPIIEDCEGVRFAPLPEVYDHLQTGVSAEQQKTDLWSQVDDFKWLRAEQSPHWSVLPEAERVKDVVWRDTVRGGSCEEVDKILQAVGVGRGAK